MTIASTFTFKPIWNAEVDDTIEAKRSIPDWLMPYAVWMDTTVVDANGKSGWTASPANDKSPWWSFEEACFIWSFTAYIAKRPDGKIAFYTQECDVSLDVYEDKYTPDTIPNEYVYESVEALLETFSPAVSA